MNLRPNESSLPPWWVKFPSWSFLGLFLMPGLTAWTLLDPGIQHGVSAFGLHLKSGKAPLEWMLALEAICFLAGLTGLFIVMKRSFAYDFGIFYCLAVIAVTIPGHMTAGEGGRDGNSWLEIATQYLLLLCFLVHLIRRRDQWRKQTDPGLSHLICDPSAA